MKKIVLCLIAVIAMSRLFAQTYSSDYLRTHPVWISMMEQESVNYVEAVKAFTLFWENRETPTEENELFNASEDEKEQKDFIESKKPQFEDAKKYAFEFKKFKYWQQDIAAFVKEDGTVMSKQEQLKFWKLQQEGRR